MTRRTTLNAYVATAPMGGINSPGTVFQITNKLNGQLIGGPTWKGSFVHKYQFNKSFSDIGILSLKDTSYTQVSKIRHAAGSIEEMQVRIGENDISNAPNGYAFLAFYSYDSTLTKLDFLIDAPYNSRSSNVPANFMIIISDEDGNYDTDYFSFQSGHND